jgi:hypothetical protein
MLLRSSLIQKFKGKFLPACKRLAIWLIVSTGMAGAAKNTASLEQFKKCRGRRDDAGHCRAFAFGHLRFWETPCRLTQTADNHGHSIY